MLSTTGKEKWIVVEKLNGARQLHPYENKSRFEEAIRAGKLAVVGIFEEKSTAKIYLRGEEAICK